MSARQCFQIESLEIQVKPELEALTLNAERILEAPAVRHEVTEVDFHWKTLCIIPKALRNSDCKVL
ncbi:MAG: hypothetical protein ACXQTI_10045 [Candidatus Nezhaarchaeales archaeon]